MILAYSFGCLLIQFQLVNCLTFIEHAELVPKQSYDQFNYDANFLECIGINDYPRSSSKIEKCIERMFGSLRSMYWTYLNSQRRKIIINTMNQMHSQNNLYLKALKDIYQDSAEYSTYIMATYNTHLLSLLMEMASHFPPETWSSRKCDLDECRAVRCVGCSKDELEILNVNMFDLSKVTKSVPKCTPLAFQCPRIETRPCGPETFCKRFSGSDGTRKLCGKRTNDNQLLLKIYGGFPAVPHSSPWTVALIDKKYPMFEEFYYCGATLIAPGWLLTAAHCIADLQEDTYPYEQSPPGILSDVSNLSLYARFGDHYMASIDEGESDVLVTHVLNHPLFTMTPHPTYDIALLKVDTQVIPDININIACLPDQEMTLPANTTCFVSGWGNIMPKSQAGYKYEQHMSKELREVQLTLQDVDFCTSLEPNNITNQESLICTTGKNKNTCIGDSGSGLFCKIPGTTNRHFLYGVVSFGTDEYNSTIGYNVKVSHVADWIKSHIYAIP